MANTRGKSSKSGGTKTAAKKTFEQLQAEVAAPISPVIAKEQAIEDERISGIKKRIGGANLESLVTDLTKTGLDLSSIIQGIVPKLTAAWQELDDVQALKDAITEEIEQLYGVDTAKKTILELVADHDRLVTEFQRNVQQTQARWEEQQDAWQKDFSARVAEANERHARDEKEFNYKTAQAQRAVLDKFEDEMRVRKNQERDRIDALTKDWATREEALKTREVELKQLQEKAASFDAEVKKAVDTAVKIATSSVSKEMNAQFALEKAGFEKTQALADANVAQLKAQNESLQSQLAAANQKLAEAHGRIADMTSKAFEAVSDRKAYEAAQAFQQGSNGAGQQKPGRA